MGTGSRDVYGEDCVGTRLQGRNELHGQQATLALFDTSAMEKLMFMLTCKRKCDH